MSTAVTTGLYVSAEALAQAPDYARALVEEHGVGLFVIRTGFDPGTPCPHLDEAVSAIARLGVSFQFLVGTWWGEGLSGSGETMTAANHLLDYDTSLAHEVQWPMVAPGGEDDRSVRETIGTLCTRYSPSGICLTHARFKHAADINSLFEIAGGPFGEAMAAAGITRPLLTSMLRTLEQRLRGISAETAPGTTLIEFLDAVTESDLFSRWFGFRCGQVAAAVAGVFEPIRQRHPAVKLGTNAMGPRFSRLSGQDYHQLAASCDFVQPLLGYMRWHVLQPIYAWATLLREKSGTLDPRAALALSARLFGFEPAELALDWDQRNQPDEGDEAAIVTMVRRQLDALGGFPPAKVAPVLRGHGLSPRTTKTLIAISQGHGFPTILFQGSDNGLPWTFELNSTI
jgi:hypothetical protein